MVICGKKSASINTAPAVLLFNHFSILLQSPQKYDLCGACGNIPHCRSVCGHDNRDGSKNQNSKTGAILLQEPEQSNLLIVVSILKDVVLPMFG